MTKREERVVKAFLTCVNSGEFTEEYAIVLIEDNQKYGWLSDVAKEYFYENLPSNKVVEAPIEDGVEVSEETTVY